MNIKAMLFPFLFIPLSRQCNSNAAAGRNHQNENKNTNTGLPQTASNNSASNSANTGNPFGVMVAKTQGRNLPPEQQVKVAKALGVKYIRARIDVQSWNGDNAAYDTYSDAGLKVILNINYGIPRDENGDHAPVPFPADMNAYSKSLNSILDKYKPEVVAIENEEDNPNYHAGSAEDYINELKTGIQIVHSKGLKVTNGGITVREICLIIYDDYMQHGQKDKAIAFAQKAFPPPFLQRINNTNNKMLQRQLEFGRTIIAAYKTLDLDYVNFHWYEPVSSRGGAKGSAADVASIDPDVFSTVVNYLKTTTGKPVMSNEFGILNSSPELIKSLLSAVRNAGLSYAIFYSADGGVGKAVGLQDEFGELRQTGVAFRDFIKQNYQQ